MTKKKDFLKDLLSVSFSNLIVLLSGIITGFIVPILLGVNEYGYFKIYTLYLTYTALLHFGFVDGLLLINAGKQYVDLDKNKFRCYTAFFIKFQLMISFIIVLISLSLNSNLRIIIMLMGFDALFLNITTYFQYISQSTLRFKELSIRKILLAVFKIILVFMLLFFNNIGIIKTIEAWMYILGIIIIDFGLLLIYIVSYHDIIFGERYSNISIKNDIKKFFKSGLALTVSFQISQLIFALDRQFVSSLFKLETYSVYAFAYNLIATITSIIGALSLVLFPRLKQMNNKQIINSYKNVLMIVSIFSMGAIVLLYPISIIINKFLIEYINSISYLKIIFPGLALNCCISIVIFTYYKSLDLNKAFFKIGCIVLIVSLLLNTISYIIFKTPIAISIASIITLIFWYCIINNDLKKRFGIDWINNFIYIILLMIIYYILSFTISNDIVIVLIYIFSYIIITLSFFPNSKDILKKYIVSKEN